MDSLWIQVKDAEAIQGKLLFCQWQKVKSPCPTLQAHFESLPVSSHWPKPMPNNRGQERPHKGALQETITNYSTDQALILLEGSLERGGHSPSCCRHGFSHLLVVGAQRDFPACTGSILGAEGRLESISLHVRWHAARGGGPVCAALAGYQPRSISMSLKLLALMTPCFKSPRKACTVLFSEDLT